MSSMQTNVTRILAVVVLISSIQPADSFHFQRPPRRRRSQTYLDVRSRRNPQQRNNRRHRNNNGPLAEELELQTQRQFFPILGSDESGRGGIAGPVVAATCCILTDPLSDYVPLPNVQDSKQVSPQERREIYRHVLDHPDVYAYNIAVQSAQQIDESNILSATMECFRESIDGLVDQLEIDTAQAYSIVDGKKSPKLNSDVPCRPFVKADAEVYTVALASILAKVRHDDLMMHYHQLYPDYQFDQNLGYQKPDHVELLHKHGPSPIHRMSFKALKGMSMT